MSLNSFAVTLCNNILTCLRLVLVKVGSQQQQQPLLLNFIRDHDPNEILDFEEPFDPEPGLYGDLSEGPARRAEIVRATSRRDRIASSMWRSYQALTRGTGLE
jgi:hypothetical protein